MRVVDFRCSGGCTRPSLLAASSILTARKVSSASAFCRHPLVMHFSACLESKLMRAECGIRKSCCSIYEATGSRDVPKELRMDEPINDHVHLALCSIWEVIPSSHGHGESTMPIERCQRHRGIGTCFPDETPFSDTVLLQMDTRPCSCSPRLSSEFKLEGVHRVLDSVNQKTIAST